MKTIIVGSRGSALALAQTKLVIASLRKACPGREFELRIIKTQGDKLSEDVKQAPGAALSKGLFTAELERGLLDGGIDLAVHSLKDLPTTNTPGLILGAIPKRADARDLLITRKETRLEQLAHNAVIATGSPRRGAQLHLIRGGFRMTPVRGNIDTRLRKFREKEEWHAMILAAAGLERLQPDTSGLVVTPISFEDMLPAPGQGALALQVAAGATEISEVIGHIHHPPTGAEVEAERSFLAALGGGCLQPIAALGEAEAGLVTLHGIAWLHDEKTPRRGSVRGAEHDAELLGRELAQEISQ